MANLSGVPTVDFSVIGDLPQAYREGQVQRARQSLADLAQGGGPIDYGQAARRLIAAGDTEGGLSLARLADQAQQRTFQQGIQERQIKLQEAAANETPKIEWHEDQNGNKVPFRVEPKGAGVKQVPIAGQPTEPTNPYASGKQNEQQAKDSLYASRMFQAERDLRDPGVEKAATDPVQRLKSSPPIPFMGAGTRSAIGNYLVTPEFQKFDQAQRNFLNAVLRRESGAAINQSEFDNAEKQYFPQPGDSPEKLAQKRQNRAEAIRGVAGGAGQNYRPPFTFDAQGGLVPNTAKPAGNAPAPAPAAAAKVPDGAAQALRAKPELRDQFDAKYGPGSAARVLGQ